MRIAISQAKSVSHPGKPEQSLQSNIENACRAVREAAEQGCGLALFGEGFLNGYQSGGMLAEVAVDVRTMELDLSALQTVCDETGTALISGATTTKGPFPGSLFNSALAFRPHLPVVTIDKLHLSNIRDKEMVVSEGVDWATGAQLGEIIEIGGIDFGIEICHDIVFPEVSRSLALYGAQAIINISAAVEDFDWFWAALPATRAIENCVYYIHATVVSPTGAPRLLGHSRVVDPDGRVQAFLADGQEAVLYAEIDSGRVASARSSLKPFTERRPGVYHPGLSRCTNDEHRRR